MSPPELYEPFIVLLYHLDITLIKDKIRSHTVVLAKHDIVHMVRLDLMHFTMMNCPTLRIEERGLS